MLKQEGQRNNTESFIQAEIYKDKFNELLSNSKVFHIMLCNDIVLRINRVNAHYKCYINMRNKYSMKEMRNDLGQLEDSLIAEEIIYHIRKAIDEMIYSLWMDKVGVLNIDNNQFKPIDSIGKYLNQNTKILDEFDEYLEFLNEINILSNSYKHSINTFSHIETDLSSDNEPPSFGTYAIREADSDVSILQDELLKMLEIIFHKFLSLI
ncbi:MAG: hypothetical protein FWG14_00555 [Peptococcaceae bacterium]|nr:hypothetical protein [Peptococcaceae bacterium]